MKLSQLEKASEFEVHKWLENSIVELTVYQKEKLIDDEIIRLSPFYFYKRPKKEKVSILWRLTLLIFPVYLLLIICLNPIKWIFTGKWGYGQKFLDNFHSKWVRKLGL